jgi:hypothetical protein
MNYVIVNFHDTDMDDRDHCTDAGVWIMCICLLEKRKKINNTAAPNGAAAFYFIGCVSKNP